jgi:Mn2+/Fe2+ NRAMP family transporter
MSMFRSGFLSIVWLIVGIIVAATHDYFERLNTVRLLLSAVLAVLLWPLVLLGIDLHIRK